MSLIKYSIWCLSREQKCNLQLGKRRVDTIFIFLWPRNTRIPCEMHALPSKDTKGKKGISTTAFSKPVTRRGTKRKRLSQLLQAVRHPSTRDRRRIIIVMLPASVLQCRPMQTQNKRKSLLNLTFVVHCKWILTRFTWKVNIFSSGCFYWKSAICRNDNRYRYFRSFSL